MRSSTPRVERAKILLFVFVFAGIAFAQTWVQMQILTASNKAENDYFGWSVSLADSYALVGANRADPGGISRAGAAYVFARSGTTWTEQAILTASNKAADDFFGYSVSLTDNYALVGAYWADSGGLTNAGAAYVFVRSGTTWTQQAILTASNKAADDRFGVSVSLTDDNKALIGAPGNNNIPRTYTFTRDGTTWTQSAFSNTCCPQPVTQTANFNIQGDHLATVGGISAAGRAIVFLDSGAN